MGNRLSCRQLLKEDDLWPANKLVFGQDKRLLNYIPGESEAFQERGVINAVNRHEGRLIATQLRFLWISDTYQSGSKDDQAAAEGLWITIGMKVLESLLFNQIELGPNRKERGMSLTVKLDSDNYEFNFVPTKSPALAVFTRCESWHKRFKCTRMFREALVREMRMTRDGSLIQYHPEQLLRKYESVENIASNKRYAGTMWLTSHRLVWVSGKSASINVSIPHSSLRVVTVKNSFFGIGLVVVAANASFNSRRPCHISSGSAGGLITAFKLVELLHVYQLADQLKSALKRFQDTPFFLPMDGTVGHHNGRWMVRLMGGVDVRPDDTASSDDSPSFNGFRSSPVVAIAAQSGTMSMTDDADDPRTPSAEPIAYTDLGEDADLLMDVADNDTTSTTAVKVTLPIAMEGGVERSPSAHVPPSPIESHYRTSGSCVVCLTSGAKVAFDPCGHLCTCAKCAETVKECPMCRESINKRLKIFLIS